MHHARFDDLVRAFAASPSRRALLGFALGGSIAGQSGPGRVMAAGAAPARTTASASREPGAAAQATPASAASVCANPSVPDLQERAPGDLIGFEEITPEVDDTFPAGARAWRVLYVSTGRDNTERQLVCGIVVAPADPPRIAVEEIDGVPTGRVVAWCHGTLGLARRCQPSVQPAMEIWGDPPYGIGRVAWGSDDRGDRHAGAVEDGILAGMIGNGWVVAATDYVGDLTGGDGLQPWVVGKIQAANVVDSVRAAHHLLAALNGAPAAERYDVVPWGHSQGGHAAVWAGQLLEPYATATATPGAPALSLAGVAAEAPGSNFVTQPAHQGDAALGYGLFDWITHAKLRLTGVPEPIPVAPFFFSYAFAAWAELSAAPAPDPAGMPAFPDVGPLDIGAVVLPQGLDTVDRMAQVCWADGSPVADLAAPFATTPFLIPGLTDGPVPDGAQHGNFDRTCAGNPSPDVSAWCAWLRYNVPGPWGDHPLPKLPTRNGRLAPVLIAAGAGDEVVHCVAPDPDATTVPSANDCAPAALYEALQTEYCPAGGDAGHLAFVVWRPEDGITAADHSDITGLVAAASIDDPRFAGSPLERFISAAFAGALDPGCSAVVVNSPAA